jgi:hypothetical protein
MSTNMKTIALVTAILLTGSVAAAQASKFDVLAEGRQELRKVSSNLLRARLAEHAGVPLVTSARESMPYAVRGDLLEVIIAATALSDDLRQAVRAAALDVVSEYEDYGLHHITVRCSSTLQLEPLSQRDDVRGITEISDARTSVGSVTSQGDASLEADSARSTFSVNGNGITVGVISDSIMDVILGTLTGDQLTGSTSQASGDLPASITVLDAGPGGGTDEGSAMAELIYDLAPGSSISFASGSTGYTEYATNITALKDDGADIIVDDLVWFTEPIYQDGPIALAAQDVVDAGVAYFSAAGNEAGRAIVGPYVDSNAAVNDVASPPSGNDFHNFGGGDTTLSLTVNSGATLNALLFWDQPYGGNFAQGPGSAVDLDLYLVSNPLVLPLTAPNIIATSNNFEGTLSAPSGDSYEWIQWTNTSQFNLILHLVIDRDVDAGVYAPQRMSLRIYRGGVGITDTQFLNGDFIVSHAAAEGVVAVAAMDYREIDSNGALDGLPGLNVEWFSSMGGQVPILFDEDGIALAQTELRSKPEITCVDGTNTTFFGTDTTDLPGKPGDADTFPNFFGTSAAAPHAAAVAALMLELRRSMTPEEITATLKATALDAEQPGYDFLAGAGLVLAPAAASVANDEMWVDFNYTGASEVGSFNKPAKTLAFPLATWLPSYPPSPALPLTMIFKGPASSSETAIIIQAVTLLASDGPVVIGS